MTIIETGRLRLRELTTDEGDAAFMLELMNEPAFLTHIGDRDIHDIDSAREHIKTGRYARPGSAGIGMFLVELKETGTGAGICGLIKRDELDDPDIGFAFHSKFRREGYALEAASAVLDYGRDQLGLKRVVAITSLTNEASAGLLAKLGLIFERVIDVPGYDGPSRLYGREF